MPRTYHSNSSTAEPKKYLVRFDATVWDAIERVAESTNRSYNSVINEAVASSLANVRVRSAIGNVGHYQDTIKRLGGN